MNVPTDSTAWPMAVLSVGCPQCKAKPGEPCNAPRKRGFHIARQDRAVALGA